MIAPIFFGLPSADELHAAPHRAILAALDANLVLADRALRARHPVLDSCCGIPDEPLLLLAEAVLASALSLHTILAAYDDLADRRTRCDCRDSSADATRRQDADDDMPF